MPKRCCVPDCIPQSLSQSYYRFPHPMQHKACFNRWVKLIGNATVAEAAPMRVYAIFRVCDRHFADSAFNTKNRLQRTALPYYHLPKSEKDMLSRLPIAAGIHGTIFLKLKSVVRKMNKRSPYCTLLFDDMAIKPHLHYNEDKDYVEGFEDFGPERSSLIANHVQVFMLRGIYKNWKQPVGYCLVNGAMKAHNMKEIIVEIIRNAKVAGLTVVSTVCDQKTSNKNSIDALVRDTQNNVGTQDYIFEVDGQLIIPLYDAPHLLKSMRNILLSRDIHFTNEKGDDKVARWKDIENAYEVGNVNNELKAMPKLTKFHVNKIKVKKMKVSVAVETLSRSVAAMMHFLARFNMIEQTSGTEEFVLLMDKVFDSVNGSAYCVSEDDPLKTLRTIVLIGKADNEQFKLWTSALPILASMFVYDKQNKKIMSAFKNWELTLKGFKLVCARMKNDGFIYIKPRSFNQDPLENFLGKIWPRGRRATRPTGTAFARLYKTLLVNGSVSKNSFWANCENDKASILISLQEFITQELSEEESPTPLETQASDVLQTCEQLKPLQQAALPCVAGYILKVKRNIKNCIACKFNVLRRPEDKDEQYYYLMKDQEYGRSKVARLKCCNVEFLKNIIIVYNVTKHVLVHVPHRKDLMQYIMKHLHSLKFNFVQCEHSQDLQQNVVSDFVKLIIFNYFKGVNKIIAGKDLRPLPAKAIPLFIEARGIWEKRQKYATKPN